VQHAVPALAALALIGAAGLAGRPLRVAGSAQVTARSVEVTYTSRAALVRALRMRPARLVRLVAPLHVAEVRPSGPAAAYAQEVGRLPGITDARRTVRRRAAISAAVGSAPARGRVSAREWQYHAVGADRVSPEVLAAAARITIAVVDTGADVTSPALEGKVRGSFDVRTGRRLARDVDGHGTFVASLAGGASPAGAGVAGLGGAARLLVVKVSDSTTFSDVDVAAGIVYAVRHDARIVNLSVAGREPSAVEQAAVKFAARHGVLLVAAAGNDALAGDPPEYPAALLQPIGSNGVGGLGLSVGASDRSGIRAGFSEYGSFVSLAAPGEAVFGALPARTTTGFSRVASGAGRGSYAYASGTSFAAPEVSGAAALVWAANPKLSFRQVAAILKRTASGRGAWNPELGFGVLDVVAAVQQAAATSVGS
jgi:subtilisin family serine protease